MTLNVVRLGSPRLSDEGTRIGTVRRPPRGVPKAQFASDDWYDAWLPELSPTPDLVAKALATQGDDGPAAEREWKAFVRAFKAQMREAGPAHTIGLLATLSQQGNLSVGCYCADESRCHRSVLRELLREAGARMAE